MITKRTASDASHRSLNRCYSTLGSPHFSWSDVLKFGQKHHLSAVEVRCLESQVVEPAQFEVLLPSPPQMREDLTNAGLRLGMLGTSVKLLDRTADELEKLQRFAELADQVNCPWLRIFDGGSSSQSPKTEQLAATSAFLENWEALRQTHQYRCQLAVETHDAFANLAITQSTLQQLPHFPILWDTHHTWRHGEDLAAYYDVVKDRAVHFHVKDSVNRPSKRKPYTYVEPGTGEFPWADLGQVLKSRSDDSCISFEWEKHWNPELAPIEEVMAAFVRVTDDWA